MKKIALLLVMVMICISVLLGCGSDSNNTQTGKFDNQTGKNDSSETVDENSSDNNYENNGLPVYTTKGADGKMMPDGETVYQPKEGEQRFLDILKEIERTQTFTITQFKDQRRCFAYDSETGTYIRPYVMRWGNSSPWYHLNGADAPGLYSFKFESEIIYVKNESGKYVTRFIDKNNKLFIYDFAITDKSQMDMPAEKVYYEDGFFAYPDETIKRLQTPVVPTALSPDNWEYVSSGVVEINGINYYCETYKVYAKKHKYEDIKTDDTGNKYFEEDDKRKDNYRINVVFDSHGNVVFMGNETYYKMERTTKLMEVFSDDDLLDIFNLKEEEYPYDPDDDMKDANGRDLLPRERCLEYEQYGFYTISANFDKKGYDLSRYTQLDSVYEFVHRQEADEDKQKQVREELGLD